MGTRASSATSLPSLLPVLILLPLAPQPPQESEVGKRGGGVNLFALHHVDVDTAGFCRPFPDRLSRALVCVQDILPLLQVCVLGTCIPRAFFYPFTAYSFPVSLSSTVSLYTLSSPVLSIPWECLLPKHGRRQPLQPLLYTLPCVPGSPTALPWAHIRAFQ